MSTQRKVVIDRKIFNGNPYLEGTRLTVFDIITNCKYDGIDVFLQDSEEFTISDIHSVANYCKMRRCDEGGSHCGGCSLRPSQDGIHSQEDFINRFAEVMFSGSDEVLKGTGEGVMVMPSTPKDLPQTWKGEDGWIMAEEIWKELQIKDLTEKG